MSKVPILYKNTVHVSTARCDAALPIEIGKKRETKCRTQKDKNPAQEPGFRLGDSRIGHLRVDIAEFGCGGRI
ncbi:hypothetical protein I6G56_13730 [Burkholderia humptydooensis]|uniref:Uncharacterized protein n=1 Tax=Burkholderia humptydooensis TaxID=430531 RepID=A0A7T2WW62_9BURK|nr:MULTISPECIES: hypothetical protein [Burkholderia]QPS42656.1 hypothetical protein I6G56_13730 [Burkholderia humptydooensis]